MKYIRDFLKYLPLHLQELILNFSINYLGKKDYNMKFLHDLISYLPPDLQKLEVNLQKNYLGENVKYIG